MVNPLSNVLVFNSDDLTSSGDACQSIIGDNSVLPISAISGDNSRSTHPFSNCTDYRDNTQYSPNQNSGSVEIIFTQTIQVELDYIGIAIHNGFAAGLTGTLENFAGGVWEEVASFTVIGDNRTIIEKFNKITSTKQRLTLNFNSSLYIGNIYLGKSWVFNKTPNLGFTPAQTNSLNRLEGFTSETNQVVMNREIELGYGQKGQYNFVPWQGDEYSLGSRYKQYMQHVKSGKPVFMKWNVGINQNFFGRASNPNSLQAPSYDGNNHGTLYFDLRGFD